MTSLDEYRKLANNPEKWRAWMATAVELKTLQKGDSFRTISGEVFRVLEIGAYVVWTDPHGGGKAEPIAASAMVQKIKGD